MRMATASSRPRATRSAQPSCSVVSASSRRRSSSVECNRVTPRFCSNEKDRFRAVLIGATFGFIVGLTSVGSGTFFGLVMVMVYPLTVAKIVGTDIFHAAALLWVAGLGHLVQGNV